MFTNSLQLAAEGWKIISSNAEARISARRLLILLAGKIGVCSVGIKFHDKTTSYTWTEKVDRVTPSSPSPDGTKAWKLPFPDGVSYWFVEGFQGNKEELHVLLNLLAEQWLRINTVNTIERQHRRLLVNSSRNMADNPSWIAVSQVARNIRSRLHELSFSSQPLLITGENGSGKKYLATLIHLNGLHPSEPFSGPESDDDTGTLFVPDWHLASETDRNTFFHGSRRLIATASPENGAESLCLWWSEMTGNPRLVIKIPPLKKHTEDIPMLAARFLEQLVNNTGLPIPDLSISAMEALRSYTWPGNIRELKEALAWAIEKHDGRRIRLEDLPPTVRGSLIAPKKHPYSERIALMEYETLKDEFTRQQGNISRTARSLGLSPRQVSWRTKKYGINPRDFKLNH